MFFDVPQNMILIPLGAFLLGWILSSISSRMSGGVRARKRDPRDDRIRSLEAELRIAQSDLLASRERIENLEDEIEDAKQGIEKRDTVITSQQSKMENIKKDLKDSVLKTRELRAELSNRAEENVRSEAKLREVETELSVAQASSELISTGVLDYSMTPDAEEANDGGVSDDASESDLSKAAT